MNSSKIIEYDDNRWPRKTAKFLINENDVGGLKIETKGLGDAFGINEGPDIGFGCEIYIETTSRNFRQELLIDVLKEVSDRMIEDGGILGTIKKLKTIPFELQQLNVLYPDGYRINDGSVCVMLGLNPPSKVRTTKNISHKNIDYISVKLIKARDFLRLRALGPRHVKKMIGEYLRVRKEYHYTI